MVTVGLLVGLPVGVPYDPAAHPVRTTTATAAATPPIATRVIAFCPPIARHLSLGAAAACGAPSPSP
jgi:hypothetical protein